MQIVLNITAEVFKQLLEYSNFKRNAQMCYRSHVDKQTKTKFMKATAKCSMLLIASQFPAGCFRHCFCTVTFDREGLIAGGPHNLCV